MNLQDLYSKIAENPMIAKIIITVYLFNVGIWGKQQRIHEKSRFTGNPSGGTFGLFSALIGLISLLFHYNDFTTLHFDKVTTYSIYVLFGSSILQFFFDLNNSAYTFQHKLIKGISVLFGVLVIGIINKVFSFG